jgi:menaquinone-dependent protoporphyrinogen oxidase
MMQHSNTSTFNKERDIGMNEKVLVAYASTNGSTQEVAEAVAVALREDGLEVDFQPMRKVKSLAGYEGIVLGAPLYIMRWHKDARRFLAKHRNAFNGQPVAVFALGPTNDKEEDWQEVRLQLDKELAKFSWLRPVATQVFGGRFDPANLRFPLNLVPALKQMPASDIRDWTAIRAWADSLRSLLLQAGQENSERYQ